MFIMTNNLQKNGMTPLYEQVADWIRNNIYNGTWGYGQQIDSENSIVNFLKVSRGTVKKAIAILCDEGLLSQVQGKGTFVTDNKISYPLSKGLLSFAEALAERNIQFETMVIEAHIEPANPYTADRLNISPGDDVFYLKRVRSVDGEPVMLIENRVNISLCRGVEYVDFTKESLFTAIERIAGTKIKFSESQYAARVVGRERAAFLQVSDDAPVLHLVQLVHLDSSKVVEFGNVWLKSNRYYLGTVYQR
jgi:transcriptional regulator, GntR family